MMTNIFYDDYFFVSSNVRYDDITIMVDNITKIEGIGKSDILMSSCNFYWCHSPSKVYFLLV